MAFQVGVKSCPNYTMPGPGWFGDKCQVILEMDFWYSKLWFSGFLQRSLDEMHHLLVCLYQGKENYHAIVFQELSG